MMERQLRRWTFISDESKKCQPTESWDPDTVPCCWYDLVAFEVILLELGPLVPKNKGAYWSECASLCPAWEFSVQVFMESMD